MATAVTVAMVEKNSALPLRPRGISRDRILQWQVSVALPVLFGSLQSVAWAQNAGSRSWQIVPSLSVSETFSDNVSLAAAGQERSEWTTRIRPAVQFIENGPRLKFNGTYSPDILIRASQGTTDISHFLSAFGTAELVQRLFYLDARASITQQNTSLLAPLADGNLNTTNNRTNVNIYSLSPYLRHAFGYDATGELRFTHDSLTYGGSTGGASASISDRINAQLTSGPAFQLLTWDLAYSQARVEYTQTGQRVDPVSASATAGRLILPDVRLNASVGYEDSGYPTTNGRTVKGNFWNLGPTWTPTPRTKISATIGHKYYGTSKSFSLSHRTSLTTWDTTYNESVTTTRGSLSIPVTQDTAATLDNLYRNEIPDPAKRKEFVDNFILTNRLPTTSAQPLSFLTDSLFLEKRWQGTVGFQGIRNTVVGSLFTSNRQALSTGVLTTAGDFSVSQNIRQTGGNLTWVSRVTATLAPSLGIGFTRGEFASSTNRQNFVRLNVTEQLSPRVNAGLSLGRSKSTSSTGAGSFTEHSITATLGLRY
jgi:uncharacterized protein (PEP-CTERM system associated)